MAAAGFRVGTFTSPHLRDYRERIRIHDRLVERRGAGARHSSESRRRAATVGLTFFEFNALAALLIFEAAELDAWVLEIGMGGRLDAVNVVDPDVAVVVSIGLDHQEYLGDDARGHRARKGRHFPPGRPAVLGSREHACASSKRCARSIGAPLKRLGSEFDYIREGAGWHYRGTRWDLPQLPPPALRAKRNMTNAATAIAALEEIDARLTIPAAAIAHGLRRVRLVGRFQVIAPRRARCTDVDPGCRAQSGRRARARAAICAVTRSRAEPWRCAGSWPTRMQRRVAAELRDCIDAWWCVSTEASGAAAARPGTTRSRPLVTAPVEAADSMPAGCAAALAHAEPQDRIVVFGSFHMVGPALDWLESRGLAAAARASRIYCGAPSHSRQG